MQKYLDRRDAGIKLAEALSAYKNRDDVVVLGLPRGGVPVAYEVAKALHAPLDVFIVRKLGVPGHRELAMGAIASGGEPIFNQEIIDGLGITQDEIDNVIIHETKELMRRESEYRGDRIFPSLENKTVILVDDGVATGASIKAAIVAIRSQSPQKIIAAVPVADVQIRSSIEALTDEFVCPMVVSGLHAVGVWYDDFTQTEDEEVHALISETIR